MISRIAQGNTYSQDTIKTANNRNNQRANNQARNNAISSNSGVLYERSEASSAAAPSSRSNANSRPDLDTVNRIRSQMELEARNLIQLIQQNFQRQAGVEADWSSDLSSHLIQADDILQAEAAELISEDGFWGVEQTSQRLFDLAVAFSGGDPAQMERMQDAVLQGFAAAERAFGGELPDISHQTLNAVMEKFDNWQS